MSEKEYILSRSTSKGVIRVNPITDANSGLGGAATEVTPAFEVCDYSTHSFNIAVDLQSASFTAQRR